MSRFSLRLHHAAGRKPVDEPLEAADEVEARELAQMRLLLTRDYDRIELRRDGAALGERRSSPSPARTVPPV